MGGVRFGIVGTGHMASVVAQAVTSITGAELRAVVGRKPSAATAFAGRFAPDADSNTFDELLGRDDVDAVYIGTPNALHAGQAIEALNAGKHVLCDKPLAFTSLEAREIVDTAVRRDRRLGLMLQNRHHPSVRLVRDEIAEGTLGRLRLARASLAFGHEDLVGWRANAALAGAAAVYNLGVHVIDAVLHLVDSRVEEVFAVKSPAREPLDRTILLVARFASGALAEILASQELPVDDVRIELLGDSGTILWNGWMAPYRTGEVVIRSAGSTRVVASECPDAYIRIVSNFAASVANGTDPNPSPSDVLALVGVTEAVLQSTMSGRAAQPSIIASERLH